MSKPTPGEELVALLTHCQLLQSDKDGLKRSAPRQAAVMDDEVGDTFAQRILNSCAYAESIDTLLDLQSRLADVGRRLEERGLLQAGIGENYAWAALAWLERVAGAGNTP